MKYFLRSVGLNHKDTLILAWKFFNNYEKQSLLVSSNRKLRSKQLENREAYAMLYDFFRRTNLEDVTFSDIDPINLIIRDTYNLLCKIKN